MENLKSFKEFLTIYSPEIYWGTFLLDCLLAALLGIILSYAYRKYGRSLANRKEFSQNFVVLILTTLTIISIVKSSLALSLGLVGALSIVRFRAAIKEPEELSYLFLCIAIGLGFGAQQRLVTVIAVIFILLFVIIRSKFSSSPTEENLFLTIKSDIHNQELLRQCIDVLSKYCSDAQLRRFDNKKDYTEISFLANFSDIKKLTDAQKELHDLADDLQVSFIKPSSI